MKTVFSLKKGPNSSSQLFPFTLILLYLRKEVSTYFVTAFITLKLSIWFRLNSHDVEFFNMYIFLFFADLNACGGHGRLWEKKIVFSYGQTSKSKL